MTPKRDPAERFNAAFAALDSFIIGCAWTGLFLVSVVVVARLIGC